MAIGVTKFNFGDGQGNREINPLSTAPTFVSSTSYSVGDYVYYQGTLYKCTTAHSGVWNASHFSATTVSAELQAKESEIADVKSDLNEVDKVVNTDFEEKESVLLNDWVIATLDTEGNISTYSSRITTKEYHRFDVASTILNTNSIKHVILCLYNDDYTLKSRVIYSDAVISIPANTLFRFTVYTNSQTITDISVIADNIKLIHESDADAKYNLEALGNGKLLLNSPYYYGNLNASGAYDMSYTNRVVFYHYMKYAVPTILNIDFLYSSVICLYNDDYTLKTRTLYNGNGVSQVVIPANTYFRLMVYKRNTTDPISDIKAFAEAVYISANMGELPNVISIFESFAVIGDSLSCGFVGSPNGNISSNEAREAGRNWVKYLSLDLNRPFTNLARGSSTAHDWRYGNTSLDVNIATADIDTYCYMVAIGVNDARQKLTVGTSADIATDKANNVDSFYGNYDYLVRQLIEYKTRRLSQAKIFVFTIPPTETNAEAYNEAIRYVATLYADVTCVDTYHLFYDKWLSYPFAGTWISGHSRPLGYAVMADMIRKGVNLGMIQHINSFLFTPWETIS